MALSTRQSDRIRRYRAMGLNASEISKLVGCSQNTVRYNSDEKFKARTQTYYRDKYRAEHGL